MEPVSIVIPTFNRRELLRHTLDSVFAAISAVDEVVVLDDGSTDQTSELITQVEKNCPGKLRYVPVEHVGVGRSHNLGIEAATHDLIAFADSDDIWLPHRLLLQRPLMEFDRELVFSFTNFGQLMPDGETVPNWLVKWTEDHRSWEEILAPGVTFKDGWPQLVAVANRELSSTLVHVGSMYRQELHTNYVNVNTLMVRRSLVGAALRFGENLTRYADWECYARIARLGKCAYLDLDTALQRTHSGLRLTQSGQLKAMQARVTLIERTWAQDPQFVQQYGPELSELLSTLQRRILRAQIRHNLRDDASKQLAKVPGALIERLLLMVPYGILKRVMGWT